MRLIFTLRCSSIGLNIVALIILGLAISMALLPTFESMLDFAM